MHPRGRRVLSRSMGSLGSALGVVGFVSGRWVHWGEPWGVRSGGLRVRSGSMGSLGYALVYVVFVRDRCVRWDTPWGTAVLSESLESLGFALGIVGNNLGLLEEITMPFILDRYPPSASPVPSSRVMVKANGEP